ncbi:MAG: multicopper oxidase domain-containing protein [Gemmatimonadales bacterium]
MSDTPLATPTTRRSFIRRSAVAAVAMPAVAGALAACTDQEPAGRTPPDTTGGTMPANAAAPAAAQTPAEKATEIDAMHEKGIKMFPAKTAGKGNQLLAPKMVGAVKVYELTASEFEWETEPGRMYKAWGYNGQIPGPQIRVREGDRVRIVLINQLSQSTSIHFHGLEVPNDQDGVPFITQPPVKPGETYTYEFTVPNSGSHMYHSHHNSTKQVGMGLLGAFVVEPKNRSREPKVDVDYVMILNDVSHGYTLNGKGFPATEPIVAALGQTVRVRLMNEGMMIHPMHLHGMHMTVIARDGWDLPAPYRCDTVNVAPGERWDVLVKCTNPGTWAFHCHILPHAESEHGMFGMVTALIVK